VQVKLLHFVAQRIARDAQQHGGARLIAARLLQRSRQEVLFRFFQAGLKGRLGLPYRGVQRFRDPVPLELICKLAL
jgi:hypothetical protein